LRSESVTPITYLVQDKAQQGQASEMLHAELKDSFNPVLTDSVAQATYGPTAHAARLTEQATLLLEGRPALTTDRLYEVWLVRLETVLTRIDAAFAGDALPQSLRVLRTSIKSILETPHAPSGSSAGTEMVPAQPHHDPVPAKTAPLVSEVAPPVPAPWGTKPSGGAD
jgi:hypothetical protein